MVDPCLLVLVHSNIPSVEMSYLSGPTDRSHGTGRMDVSEDWLHPKPWFSIDKVIALLGPRSSVPYIMS